MKFSKWMGGGGGGGVEVENCRFVDVNAAPSRLPPFFSEKVEIEILISFLK